MSTEDVAEFLRALEEDDAFKERCGKALEADGPEAVVELAAERGRVFTVEELAEAVGGDGELDDEALDKVAGGMFGGLRVRSKPRTVRGAYPRSFSSRLRPGADRMGDEEEDVPM